MTPLTTKDIDGAVAAYFGLGEHELYSADTHRPIAWPRFIAVHLARKHTSWTTTKLAAWYNKKDHTTIVHAARRANELIDTDIAFKAQVKAIEKLLEDWPRESQRLTAAVERGLRAPPIQKTPQRVLVWRPHTAAPGTVARQMAVIGKLVRRAVSP